MGPRVRAVDEDEDQDVIGFDAAGFAKAALASRESLAAVIDHTLLKPEATQEQVKKLCRETAE
ncbi:MAG TPA: hypothetical protein VMD25_02785, partial [Acidobacteriaceae bacterium]|nr:hypothetical protein [Acidobacteriaceae bacterium]